MKNKVIFLERRLAFIEEKLRMYENAKGPIINTIPVRLYDAVPLFEQNVKTGGFLLVLVVRKNDNRCPIIKISENVLKELAFSDTEITINDYIHTETFAEKTIHNNQWIWKQR